MNNALIYVYCLVNSPPELSPEFMDKGLESIQFGDFYVIVKHVSEQDFSEENFQNHLSDLNWLETNAREHVEVINLIMPHHSVIPFKFGTIFQAETGVEKFISDYADSLKENFLFVGNKEEWSVKIYCDRKLLCHQIDEVSQEAAALEKLIMESSPGKAYLLKRKKMDLIENELDRICKLYGQEYFDELKALSESTNLNNLLPKEYTGRDDTMILNGTFLVSKSMVASFGNAVKILTKKDENFGFLLEISGPWPPFSFVYIKEK
ncbi:MAG: GvpL/GvpF family gas vesicle protein [Prolixibacteraceae bacterium]